MYILFPSVGLQQKCPLCTIFSKGIPSKIYVGHSIFRHKESDENAKTCSLVHIINWYIYFTSNVHSIFPNFCGKKSVQRWGEKNSGIVSDG